VTIFAPGEGRAVEVTEQWVKALRIGGTRVYFEYEQSGHFEFTHGIRRQADRDAFEVCALAEQTSATRALGFSRGARALVGALMMCRGRFERVVLVWPPAGRAVGDYVSWVGNDAVVPKSVTDPRADVLVVVQEGDRWHPVRLAEQWASALGAELEVLAPGGLFQPGFAEVVSEFLNA
jgi:hypothetical protein